MQPLFKPLGLVLGGLKHPGLVLAAFVAASTIAPAIAADVYRCTVDEKTIYQSKPCAEGKKLDLPDNAVAPVDQSAAKAKNDAMDKAMRDKQQARKQSEATTAALCQAAHDMIARQEIYLRSRQPNAREAAQTEIDVQRRKLQEYGCQ